MGVGRSSLASTTPKVFAAAKEKIAGHELAPLIELRNESSLEMRVEGTIDILFVDSDPEIREAEVRRFLPQVRPTGLVLMHDASSHMKTVRDAAFKLEAEGLLSCVFLATPRGLVVAQRREGRA